ncbi:MAG TPA: tetraacyldisaccharide 4'-kinase [Candidatus Marinimicrobia bacterium]|nr:tetraacyldisaccharide 4'-kinase [Candidatus Neomarinimicrobiota bacterium]HRS52369.1 tetraacyldisaccharide 4'-kinase [Candidatus Neomarinimicrobiota bacterium]HRU92982.1 tetraacyldisaccharide 4'-kinase [Candidatus Neomarinimicrobiota bacterium]
MQSSALRWLLYPAALLYGLITKLRNLFYDWHIFKTAPMPVPVIAVGNITAGGTGKTPFVIALSKFLSGEGYRIAIVTRGYRRQSKGSVVVSDGRQILATPQQAGDEPFLMAGKLPGVVIIADADRVAAARIAIEKFACNLIIADDAFQHRRLARDINIVLWDPTTHSWQGHLLPVGRLREAWRGLKRADYLVFSKTDKISPEQQTFFEKYNPGMMFFTAPLKIVGLRTLSAENVSISTVTGKNLLAFCGLGNHAQFEATVQQLNCNQVIFQHFPDHHHYTADDLQRLIIKAKQMNCDYLVTTEKDAVNLPPNARTITIPLLIIEIELELSNEIKAAILQKLPPLSNSVAGSQVNDN